jgi:hypothetical protein
VRFATILRHVPDVLCTAPQDTASLKGNAMPCLAYAKTRNPIAVGGSAWTVYPVLFTLSGGAISVGGSTLATPVGKDLSIVGGPVRITGGQITAPAGRLHIASAAGSGEIGLNGADTRAHTVSVYGPVNCEARDVLRAGLETSPYVSVDDTGARHAVRARTGFARRSAMTGSRGSARLHQRAA